jgi:hypothetical protein
MTPKQKEQRERKAILGEILKVAQKQFHYARIRFSTAVAQMDDADRKQAQMILKRPLSEQQILTEFSQFANCILNPEEEQDPEKTGEPDFSSATLGAESD